MRPVTTAGNMAYGFAWFRFPCGSALFFIVPTIRAVPRQAALIPVLQDLLHLGVNGTFPGIWLARTGFVLPLAWYLLVQLCQRYSQRFDRGGAHRRGLLLYHLDPHGSALVHSSTPSFAIFQLASSICHETLYVKRKLFK